MENASKALLIAGSILIALLVATALVVSWTKITSYLRAEEESDLVKQVDEFNQEFESYNKGIVRGYELVSLNNLIDDTNERFMDVDGYKEVEAYVKFKDGETTVTQASGVPTAEYGSLHDFMNTGAYGKAVHGGDKDYQKIFKESYFQCDKTVYDGEDEATGNVGVGSGRVCKLYFTQIVKK